MDTLVSLQAAWVAVHVMGLAAACLLRVYADTAAESLLQALFLCGLACVAVAALAGQQYSWSVWTASGLTMGAMVIIAVAEGKRRGA
jgi:hypothetical protein